MLITFFVYLWPEGYSDPSNKVESLIPAELLLVSWYEEGSEVPLQFMSLPQ